MWRCGEPKTGVGRRTQRGAQACPEGAGEARVAVLDGRCVAEHGRDETARLPLGGGCLEGRDRPHCTCRKSWLELATGSSRTSRLVNPPLRPYKPAASPAVDRKGKRPAGRWQACGLDARLGNRRAGPPRAAAAEHPVAADAGAARNTRCRAPGTELDRRISPRRGPAPVAPPPAAILCNHEKGRRGRHQKNILCERLLTSRPCRRGSDWPALDWRLIQASTQVGILNLASWNSKSLSHLKLGFLGGGI